MMNQVEIIDSSNMSYHSYLEPFICAEERCINMANEAAIDFELPKDILTGNHMHSKHHSEFQNNENDEARKQHRYTRGVKMGGELEQKFMSQTFGDDIAFKFKMPATEIYLS